MSQQAIRILVVDDESAIRRALRPPLMELGFQVSEASRGEEALQLLRTAAFDAVLLDVNMPGIGGIETLRRMRAFAPRLPILMLTVRDQEEDKVEALDLGADDYVTKPFDTLELMARIEAILRRSTSKPSNPNLTGDEIYRFGTIVLDVRKTQVTMDNKPVNLTAREFHLFCYFAEHQGVTLSRDELLREVWGQKAGTLTRTVDMHVASLRQKLKRGPRDPEMIVTVSGIGYRFQPD